MKTKVLFLTLAAALVAMPAPAGGEARKRVADLEFLGEVTFATGTLFMGTTVGGLSGITYDAANDVYYAISDDRSQINPARFYKLEIDLGDGSLDAGDVTFTGVTTLRDGGGLPFPIFSLDPEGIAFVDGDVFVSSEGQATGTLIDPFVNLFDLSGNQLDELPVPDDYLPTADQSSGIRNNLAFESLAATPDEQFLYTATENALFQDGPAATLSTGSPCRILQYDLGDGEPKREFFYVTEEIPDVPVPATAFATNGLVELLALDNRGTMLALERAFSTGVSNNVRLYEIQLDGVQRQGKKGEDGIVRVEKPVKKDLVFDFAALGITLDNLEGMTFGPDLADGRKTLIVVSDNNFSAIQFTQFLAFAVDIKGEGK